MQRTSIQKVGVYTKPISVSLVLSIIISIQFYLLYCLYHFGSGSVSVPEWHTGYDSKGLPVPFPLEQAIEYWKTKGRNYATLLGGVSLFIFFTLIAIKHNLKKSKI